MPVLMDDLKLRFNNEAVIVSPDAGGVERARAYSKRLGTSLAIIDKRRPAPNVSEVVNIIGDVKGRDAIIVDDMVDTAGTLCAAAQAVMAQGARSVQACVSHGVLSPPAIERIMMEEVLHNLEVRTAERRAVTGVPTGFTKLDELTAGLQRENLIIVAARPGGGKTSWAVNVAMTKKYRPLDSPTSMEPMMFSWVTLPAERASFMKLWT